MDEPAKGSVAGGAGASNVYQSPVNHGNRDGEGWNWGTRETIDPNGSVFVMTHGFPIIATISTDK